MQVKVLEVRDRATYIPVIAILMEVPAEGRRRYHMRRHGYSEETPAVMVTPLSGGGHARVDPYQWADRTYQAAHLYIEDNWDKLSDGDVVCVETILGERSTPKVSEALGGE